MIGKIACCLLFIALVSSGFALVAHAGAGDIDKDDRAQAAAVVAMDRNPYTGDAAAITEGRSLWRKTGCYSCHGGVAEGGVGPSLIDDEWVYKPTDKTLFKAIAKGRKGTVMVAWAKDLDGDQIWKVIAFIRSLYQGDPNKIIW
ncbi:MAG: c-type cytochrome [Alphaproteobacteria bacterium]|jgi:cytochrome c(L)|nr:c-type cytochrome [Alphaproteobacteria bacterium]MDP6517294.1 c-type cytochrome [Alphaproteobacteria bacterium]